MSHHGGIFVVVLVVALVVAAVFGGVMHSRGLRRIGVWPIFVIFFLPVLLASWAGALWLRPVGPIIWGVPWVPIVCVGLATALILASFTPRRPPPASRKDSPASEVTPPDRQMDYEVSTIFWVALIFFGLLLLGGFLMV